MNLMQMSVSGGMLILAIVLIRALLINRLPKRTFLALWGIVLMRLLIPFSIPSIFGVFSLMNAQAPMQAPLVQATNPLPIVPMVQGLTRTAAQAVLEAGSMGRIVWLVGAMLCAAFFIGAYWRFRWTVKTALPIRRDEMDQWLKAHPLKRPIVILQTKRIAAPLTYGVFRPVILMPQNTDWSNTQQLNYVLSHEYVHITRYDTALKLILTLALCLHWFNPMVWVMYILFNRDMELSCDECVLRQFGEPSKSAYARTLIGMEETKSNLTPLCNHFSKHAIEERITAIMKYKKSSVAVLALAILLVTTTLAFAITATSEAPQENFPQNNPIAQATTYVTDAPQDIPIQWEPLPEYEQFGISYDGQGNMLFDGQLVRYFWDGYDIEPGMFATHYDCFNEAGVVDVHTLRSIIDNGDGSVDHFGALLDIVADSQQAFEERDIDWLKGGNVALAATAVSEEGSATPGRTFEEIFETYKDYGITFVASKDGGIGNVYYHGQLVKRFVDEDTGGGVFMLSSKDGGELVVHAVYDANGDLTGVEAK